MAGTFNAQQFHMKKDGVVSTIQEDGDSMNKRVVFLIAALLAGLESRASSTELEVDQNARLACESIIYLSAQPEDRELIRKVLSCENLRYMRREDKERASIILQDISEQLSESSKPMFTSQGQ